jgi:hypothetical protein
MCAFAHAQAVVIVELFTSEGCSSCPPADLLLQKLENQQPVVGVHVVALSEHVDYWDRLGWRDPFSAAQFSSRQQEYSQVFRDSGPYTPEMVIDGAAGFVGNDSEQALRSIAKAGRAPKAAVQLSGGAGSLMIRADGGKHAADVVVAITESNLLSNVSRGENAGHRLTHTAVVRWLRTIGKTRAGEAFTAEVHVPADPAWKVDNLRAVAFLQDRSSRRILGAAEVTLR